MSDISVGAVTVSGLSATVAVWVQQFSVFLFGINVASLIAAFAGAVIVLSVIPPLPFVRAVFRVIGGTIAAAFSTPLVAQMLPGPFLSSPKVETGIALVLGLFVLLFIEGAVEVIKKLPEDIRTKILGKL